ncbi:junctional adhesion molecule C-like isoform X2 [Anneissia japonica]|uniref:junctional adhesion molecule C-like isoform X2 n=1 Tax=Anneissia japonica TaxID=1529436 RepID=UPI001425620E|nr:junctional adhesion molecule C-like isoform X2 [Anneissia japonica]
MLSKRKFHMMMQRDFNMMPMLMVMVFIVLCLCCLLAVEGVEQPIIVHEAGVAELYFNYRYINSTEPPILRFSKFETNGELTYIGTYHNGSSNVEDRFKARIDLLTGKLRINSTMREDSGCYECELQILRDQLFIKKTVNLTVLYLDMPVIVSPKNVVEGDLLDILCYSGAAYPDPILTLFKGQQLIHNKTGTILNHTISKATRNDTGDYICRATNDVGSKDSYLMRIHIKYSNHSKEDKEDTPSNQPTSKESRNFRITKVMMLQELKIRLKCIQYYKMGSKTMVVNKTLLRISVTGFQFIYYYDIK